MAANLKVQAFKRGLIIETADQLFREKPYEVVTIEDISKAAGFGKSTIYSFFESKEEILAAIIINALEQLSGQLQQISREESDARVALEMSIPFQYLYLLGYHSHLFTYIQKTKSNSISENLREEVRRAVMDNSAHLLHLMQKGIQEGIFAEADPEYLTWFTISIIKGVCMPSLLMKPELRDQAKDIEMLKSIILKSVMPGD